MQNLKSRSNNASNIVNKLFKRPIINAAKVKKHTGLSMPAAYTLIHEMEKQGVIHEITGAKRGKVYVFRDYIDLFR